MTLMHSRISCMSDWQANLYLSHHFLLLNVPVISNFWTTSFLRSNRQKENFYYLKLTNKFSQYQQKSRTSCCKPQMAVIVEESRFTYQDFILRDFGKSGEVLSFRCRYRRSLNQSKFNGSARRRVWQSL